jgi:prolyl 4-hydroxylase
LLVDISVTQGGMNRPPDSAQTDVAAADRVLLGADVTADPVEAWRLYEAAAERGSGLAAERLAVLQAVGVARPADFGAGLVQLARAADLGHRPAQRQLALLSGRKDLMTRTPKAPIWGKVRDEIDLKALLAPGRTRREHLTPSIHSIEHFIPRAYCTWIIDHGRTRLSGGQVSHVGVGAPRTDAMRTAEAAPFTLTNTDLVVVLVQEKLARTASIPLHWGEPPNLLHYAPGQEYQRHYDFIDPRVPAFQPELAVLGQRVATCLVYLNEDFDGGETEFPHAGWRYRGKPGDAIVFSNVTQQGQPDPASLHAGRPPTRGEKWLLSLWVRDRVQPIC